MIKTTHRALICIISFHGLFWSCTEHNEDVSRNKYVKDDIKVNNQNVPLDSIQNYFPYELFANPNSPNYVDKALVDRYSTHLFEMEEPLLFNKKTEKESYRFLYLRSFDDPIAIRIERNGNEIYLYWKQWSRIRRKLVVNRSKKLKVNDWNTITKELNSTNFWNEKLDDLGGVDEAEWILEGATQTHYNVIQWSDLGGVQSQNNYREKYDEVCRYLIDLTDLNISENLI